MHIHKINTISQKYQNFLAQNRKDPITGDSILEGDEVVFCAICKSVFLSHTWEYLGKQHCEQTETLIEFPAHDNIHLKAEGKILFYHKPINTKQNISIPSLAKDNPWVTKHTIISPFQNYFNKLPFIITFVSIFFIGVILQIVMRPIEIMPYAFSCMVFVMACYMAHDFYFGSRLKTIYKKFTRNVFYITRESIGFSLPYGRKEYNLPIQHIKELYFYEERGFLDKNYCKITYNKEDANQVIKVNLYSGLYKELDVFFSALKTLSNSISVTIKIDSKEKNTLLYVQQIIDKENNNFVIIDTQ